MSGRTDVMSFYVLGTKMQVSDLEEIIAEGRNDVRMKIYSNFKSCILRYPQISPVQSGKFRHRPQITWVDTPSCEVG